MRRRFSFNLAFAALIVAQVAVIVHWQSRRPPPTRIRETIDDTVGSLRGWADKLEQAAVSTEPGNPALARVFRDQAATDRKLADRLESDPVEGMAIMVAIYMQFHDNRCSTLLRGGLRPVPPDRIHP